VTRGRFTDSSRRCGAVAPAQPAAAVWGLSAVPESSAVKGGDEGGVMLAEPFGVQVP
jgi:hypothetical protein